MQPRPHERTKHQTSFFAHEVFDYFLPAQKVIRPAGEGGEAKKNHLTYALATRLQNEKQGKYTVKDKNINY